MRFVLCEFCTLDKFSLLPFSPSSSSPKPVLLLTRSRVLSLLTISRHRHRQYFESKSWEIRIALASIAAGNLFSISFSRLFSFGLELRPFISFIEIILVRFQDFVLHCHFSDLEVEIDGSRSLCPGPPFDYLNYLQV